MRSLVLAHEVDWGGFRSAARTLTQQDVPPEQILWSVRGANDLFAGPDEPPDLGSAASGSFTLPRSLVTLAETVIQANESERFALLYR